MPREIQHDDYKRIRKETGLSPRAWLQLQRLDARRHTAGAYDEHQIKVYACRCGSVWCERCSKFSKTNERISKRLSTLDWEKVRHVVLTVAREDPPDVTYFTVTEGKHIPRLIRALKMTAEKWVWILEFHIGGFPHWHLLIESHTGMIGHGIISKKWRFGLVWESYIRSENHWKAIIGYHRSKGYLAGEQKGHQLQLPGYLGKAKTVRKFASNFSEASSGYGGVRKSAKKRRKRTTLAERFGACDTKAKWCLDGFAWGESVGPLAELKGKLDCLEKVDHMTYNIPSDVTHTDVIMEIATSEEFRGVPKRTAPPRRDNPGHPDLNTPPSPPPEPDRAELR